MDEGKLRTLFREAVYHLDEPPAPGFDLDTVAAESRRLTARRRARIATTCSCVVLVLAGLGVLGSVLQPGFLGGSSGRESAQDAPARIPLNAEGQPTPPAARPQDTGFPDSSPKQGGEGSGENGPRAGSTSGCDKVDRELVTALAGELPVTASGEPTPGRLCDETWRSAGLLVNDGARSGEISVTVVPRGVAVQLSAQPEGTETATKPTAGGGTIWVFSTPTPGTTDAPLPGAPERIASALAPRF